MSGYKNCPYCDEEIKEIAVKCRYCKSILINENKQDLKEEALVGKQSNKTKDVNVPDYQPPSSKKKNYGLIAVLFIAIILVLFGAIFMVGLLDVSDIYALLGSEESVEYLEAVIEEEPDEDSETTINNEPEDGSETNTKDGIIGNIIFVDVPETTFLHLRSGPGSSYSSLDQLNRGNVLYVVGETIDSDGGWWLNVWTLDVIEGWVHSNYVTDNPGIIKSHDISDEELERNLLA